MASVGVKNTVHPRSGALLVYCKCELGRPVVSDPATLGEKQKFLLVITSAFATSVRIPKIVTC